MEFCKSTTALSHDSTRSPQLQTPPYDVARSCTQNIQISVSQVAYPALDYYTHIIIKAQHHVMFW